mgnify:CR=1 FL=1
MFQARQSPYLLIFNIYSANNEQNSYDNYKQLLAKMVSTMTESLKIQKSTALSLVRKINIRNYNYIWRKHNQLLAYIVDQNEAEHQRWLRVRGTQTEKYHLHILGSSCN